MKIPRILAVPIAVALVVAFSFLVGLVANWFGVRNPTIWGAFTFFGILIITILFVFGRQFYWWLRGKGDYVGGGLPKLWGKIFKK